ncbi:regulatory protein RecX [Cellulomonas fimi]|uniref:Regulatory protein RecX n=1 Tax=Cellulomonas fimi TaxID=1708 RepID=A0A7Y0LX42_CELFI|nr:regulatory protein RecX [Cellulomonas fimi]NMR19524.1 regulatory protein RecX [Cellulomonas fimi]
MTGDHRRGGGSRRAGLEPPAEGAAAVDREPDAESVARAIALRLLTGAPRSRAQLAEAMARKDVPDGVADAVLDRFTEVGLIDDAEYARILVRSRHADRGLSRRALSVELRRKGIEDELAAEALQTLDDEQEEATARDLARRRLARTVGLAREVRMRRVVGMLGRKGYAPGLAVRIVREMLDDEGSGEASEDVSAPDPWLLGDD